MNIDELNKYKKVVVVWYDASDQEDLSLADILSRSFKSLLIKRITIGYLLLESDEGFLILQDIDQNNKCEVVVIPKNFKPIVKEVLIAKKIEGGEQ